MPRFDEFELNSEPIYATLSQESCDAAWEAAYQRFETPEQEIRKFQKRLRSLGANSWSTDARIAELFCGRGNGLVALEQLGFNSLQGVDLSAGLVSQYQGPAKCYVADCRDLPFESQSIDIAIVQGGLHHLPTLPGDLEKVLTEVRRVLAPQGRFVIVEPWKTPFLDFVHQVCSYSIANRISGKIEALGTMIEHERETYYQWLSMPSEIISLLHSQFEPIQQVARWGKLCFVGGAK